MSANWTDQAQEMMNSWTQAQTKLWEGWTQAAAQGNAAHAFGTATPELWSTQWQEAALRGLQGLAGGAQGVPREVAERLFAGEQAYLGFVDGVMRLLKAVAPQVPVGGEHWAELLKRYLAQLKEGVAAGGSDWLSPTATAAAAKDVPELWRLYNDEVQKLVTPWIETLRASGGHFSSAVSGDQNAPLKMFNIFMDTFESTLGKFVSAPAIGYTREFQERCTKAFETWVDVRRAEVDFQSEVQSLGFKSMERLIERLVELGDKGDKVTSLRQLFDLWIDTSEKVYFEAASTDAFASLQARFVNAAMEYRISERLLVEEYLKALHLPTRGELDDTYRHLADTRRKVKVVQKDVSSLREAVDNVRVPDVSGIAGTLDDTVRQMAAMKKELETLRASFEAFKKSAAKDAGAVRPAPAPVPASEAAAAEARPVEEEGAAAAVVAAPPKRSRTPRPVLTTKKEG